MRCISRLFLAIASLPLIYCHLGQAAQPPQPRYFMIVFAYEGSLNLASHSHTFASFISEDALNSIQWVSANSDPRYDHWRRKTFEKSLNVPTISWLPESSYVSRLLIQTGKNHSLDETFQRAKRQFLHAAKEKNYGIAYWGPYEITPELYFRAMRRIDFLKSGAVDYTLIAGPPSDGILNCIHAVSDIGGPLYTKLNWGKSASAMVVAHLGRWIINYPQTYSEVARLLRLNERISSSLEPEKPTSNQAVSPSTKNKASFPPIDRIAGATADAIDIILDVN